MQRVLFLLLLLMLCFPRVFLAQSIELNLDLNYALPLHSKLNGFNTGGAFNEIFEPANANEDIVDRCALFPAPFNKVNERKIISMTPKVDFVSKTAELKPSVLRFPGGTIANYYHLYEYENGVYNPENPKFAKGFGTQELETKAYPSANTIGRQYCVWDNRVDLANEDQNPNYIQGFSNLINNIEQEVQEEGDQEYKIDVIYVANLLTHFDFKFLFNTVKSQNLIPSDPSDYLNIADPNTPFELYYKEVEDAVTLLKNQNVNVIGVELSNEVYFPVYRQGNNNVTPEEYMKLGEIYAARLRAKFPGIQIAIASEAANNAWNTVLANYDNVFYDAIVLHNYYTNTTCINPNENCDGACTNDPLNDRQCRFDCGKCVLGNYVNNDLFEIFEDAIKAFPEETKIWMTEWGIISPNGQKSNLDYFNTLLYSAFTMEHLLKQMSYNANHSDRIQYSTHHRIGYKIQWSIIRMIIQNPIAEIRSNFYSYSFMNDLFYADSLFALNGFVYPDDLEDTDLTSEAFLSMDDDELSLQIAFANKTDQELPFIIAHLPSLSFQGKGYKLAETGEIDYLQGNDEHGLYSSFGITKFNGVEIDEAENPSLSITENEVFSLTNLRFPKYSVGVITIPLNNTMVNTEEVKLNQNHYHIFPNPSHTYINLQGKENVSELKIDILDAKGQLIYHQFLKNTNQTTINIAELGTGAYFLRATDKTHTQVLRFVRL